ncbi:hypothetical protein I3760_15G119000 [Carya illinoinensis]|nr:hypothetical protein I3760_15G119000 [Carya illinoinensis]
MPLSLTQIAPGLCFYPDRRRGMPGLYRVPHFLLPPVRPTSLYSVALEERKKNDWKRSICAAEESPLLLLSGVGTNAIGYDLSPESSFARYMSGQGFETWILEVRGAGLSTRGINFGEIKQPLNAMRESLVKHGVDVLPSERRSTYYSEAGQNSGVASQFRDLSQWLANVIEESQVPVPTQFLDFREPFFTTLDELQKQLDLIVNYDWDFDHYLEEDLPAVMEYIKTRCKPKDGKLLAIGHSMGGILLYAMLNSGLASVATLASSLDYTSSKSSLKLLLPLADPAEALKVPVIPIGGLLSAAHPLASRTVPAKVLLQLTTAFQKGGLRARSGTFFYKDHLRKTNVPILALAGDQDLICPPEAVYVTVKLISEDLVAYKVLGEPGGPHNAH